jgi:hypothetical protein
MQATFHFSKFTSEQAWSLTNQVLDRILADLFMSKKNLIPSLKTRNTPSTSAQALVAAFQMHDIMAVLHKFENHQSLSTEYFEFLAINSGSEKVVKWSESLDVIKTRQMWQVKRQKLPPGRPTLQDQNIRILIKKLPRSLKMVRVWRRK